MLKIIIIFGIGYLYWLNHRKRSTLLWDYELRKKASYILASDFRASDEEIMEFFTHKTYKRYMKRYRGEEYLSSEQINHLGRAYIEFVKGRK